MLHNAHCKQQYSAARILLWSIPGGGLMRISDILTVEQIVPAFAAKSGAEVLAALATTLMRPGDSANPPQILAALEAREAQAATALGSGVAIPHARLADLEHMRGAFLRCAEGVPFGAPDGTRVQLFFALLTPADAPGAHLRTLASISRLLSTPRLRAALLGAGEPAELFSLLSAADAGARPTVHAA